MGQINLKIVTPEGGVLDQPVDIVTVRTITGYMGILHDHVPVVSTLVPSVMSYRINGQLHKLHISGGIMQTNQEYVKIISDNVETDEVRKKRLRTRKTKI